MAPEAVLEAPSSIASPEGIAPVADPKVADALERVERKLSDPNYMRNIMGVEQPTPQPQQNPDDERPKFEPIDTSSMTMEQALAEQERRTVELLNWKDRQIQRQLQERDNNVTLEKQQNQRQQEVDHIRQFANETTDFKDYDNDIRALYMQPLSVEDAYEFAKLRRDAKTRVDNPAPSHGPMRASQTGSPEGLTKEFDTVRDGTKAAIDEVLGAMAPGQTL